MNAMNVTDQDKVNTYYQALLDRNSQFVGTFFAAVKTTSVFCIPTCRARKPKFENVEFYHAMKDALNAGYRPCKVCRPTENAHEAPIAVKSAMDMVREHPKEKIRDDQLRRQGISPERVRRWFKNHYGMTFQAYQRMYRINSAFQEIKGGSNITDTAFDSGYASLSGFNYMFKNVVGAAPSQSFHGSVIVMQRITSPLGPMFICATDEGVCLLEFVDRRMLETEIEDLQRRLKSKIITGDNPHIQQAKKELAEYFDGARTEFHVTLHTPGSDFQRSVWQALQGIPFGSTRSYQQQAEALGKPSAVRAVASANGCNRVAIIIPCHRVIGKDGKLTGYGGGLERKRWLLDHEQTHRRDS